MVPGDDQMASGTFMITQGPCPLADLIPRRVAHHHRKSQQLISDFAGALHHHLHYQHEKIFLDLKKHVCAG
jgi:hypothetical protein